MVLLAMSDLMLVAIFTMATAVIVPVGLYLIYRQMRKDIQEWIEKIEGDE